MRGFAVDDLVCDGRTLEHCSSPNPPYNHNCRAEESMWLHCGEDLPMMASDPAPGSPPSTNSFEQLQLPLGVETGASHCNECPAGTFNEQGDAHCEACPSGQFGTALAATSANFCSSCPAETVSATTRFGDGTGLMVIDGEVARVALRLAGDEPGAARGALEMSIDDHIFRPVCDHSPLRSHEAAIICRALGYHGRNAYTYSIQSDPWRFAAEGIRCADYATTLEGCAGQSVGVG